MDTEQLAVEYANKSLEELEAMEQAIKDARSLKADMKRDDVPQEDIEELQAAWKLVKQKKRINVTVDIVIETDCCDSDPCSVYTRVVSPDWLSDWDAEVYSDFWGWSDDVRNTIIANELDLRKRVELANKIHREFEAKHDVDACDFT